MIDDRRLVDVFRRELEATRRLEDAVHAVAAEAIARAELPDPTCLQMPLRLPPVLVHSAPLGAPMHDKTTTVEEQQIKAILKAVADDAGMTVSQLVRKDRRSVFTHARFVAMALLRERTHLSLPRIAQALLLGDHTTVLYGLRQVKDSEALQAKVVAIGKLLDGASLGATEAV